jgi:hypothetical protein
MVDPVGWGLACYYKDPDESDQSREQIIIATLAGFAAEKRFREERSYPARGFMDVTLNRDNVEARTLLTRLAGNYASNEASLNNRLQDLIGQHWLVIEALAAALLAKDWEPLRPLKSGGKWSHENASIAKYVTGEEAVRVLAQHRIAAVCDPSPSRGGDSEELLLENRARGERTAESTRTRRCAVDASPRLRSCR